MRFWAFAFIALLSLCFVAYIVDYQALVQDPRKLLIVLLAVAIYTTSIYLLIKKVKLSHQSWLKINGHFGVRLAL